jgi:hypothetical protein
LSSAPTDESRYSFYRVQDGFVRLDSRTGQVAQCGWAASGWSCQVAPNERSALESEIGRLQGENAALKKELLARGIALPGGAKSEPPPSKGADKPAEPPPEAKMPTDTELDRAMAFMEKIWRRLVEMMVTLQRDMQRKS